MKKFKDFFVDPTFNNSLEVSSVDVTFGVYSLSIRFDSKDAILSARYQGPLNPWMSSMCYLIEGKSLGELVGFTWKQWEIFFQNDQTFWDYYDEESRKFIFEPLELLFASLNVYQGRDYLYQEESPLVCRCFGVREKEIRDFLQTETNPTLENLVNTSKAGMGCRSCVLQLKRWLMVENDKKNNRYFKSRPAADWLLDIDRTLADFPKALDWKMEVSLLKGNQVTIIFDKEVSQREEELTGRELQDFLGRSVDLDLSFFLRRARHFSNAKG
jgi:bacterioferritin-associated ferredoxin